MKKKYSLFLIVLVLPIFGFTQSLTGLWVGSLQNDSNSVRKDQSFEIVLTEYRGKVYGFSRTEFIVNDTLYFILKRVKGTIAGDSCEVKDDEILSYNFRGKLDKGIKVTSTFRRNKTDSTWQLEGSWKTNATKKYYAVTGKVALEEEKDLRASKIFPHLEEINKADDVAFYKDRKEAEPIRKLVKPEKRELALSLPKEQLTTTPEPTLQLPVTNKATPEQIAAINRPAEKQPPANQSVAENPPAEVVKTDITTPGSKSELAKAGKAEQTIPAKAVVKKEPVAVSTKKANTSVSDSAQHKIADEKWVQTNQQPVSTQPANIKKESVQTDKTTVPTVVSTTVRKEEPAKTLPLPATTVTSPTKMNEAAAAVIQPKEDVIKKSAVIEGRKSEFAQEVNFSSDSLQLSLYDNGEIDGDTVSVYMNGENILPSQGLKSSAIKKTIYLPAGTDEFTLVMFAESLGKYPPNTGLLVIRDGDDVYNLRFSSDFQKSSGIVFRRKK